MYGLEELNCHFAFALLRGATFSFATRLSQIYLIQIGGSVVIGHYQVEF